VLVTPYRKHTWLVLHGATARLAFFTRGEPKRQKAVWFPVVEVVSINADEPRDRFTYIGLGAGADVPVLVYY
jgi:hypothetical protein